jgi:hypothetical protein
MDHEDDASRPLTEIEQRLARSPITRQSIRELFSNPEQSVCWPDGICDTCGRKTFGVSRCDPCSRSGAE